MSQNASPAMANRDLYRSILQVRQSERPPTPYQLLNLDEFEDKRTKIVGAADRQRARVNTFSNSVDSEQLQQLRGDVDEAQRILLDVERKALLDAKLRRRAGARIEPPESANGSPVECHACGEKNGGRSQFCQSCGVGLWTRCAQCTTVVATSQKFCNSCGVNLHEANDTAASELKKQLADAVQLAKAHDFSRATSSLKKIALVDDSRFAAICDDALAWIEKVDSFRTKSIDKAGKVLHDSREFIQRKEYAKAIRIIDAFPDSLWTEDIRAARDEAHRRALELRELRAEIASSLEAKKFRGLSTKIERLQTISPTPEEAESLAKSVASKFSALAQKCIEQRRFGDALSFINEIPTTMRSDKVKQLETLAHSGKWLADDVLYAAAPTPVQLQFALKLTKQLPKDANVREAAQRLAAASKRAPSDLRWGFPPSREEKVNRYGAPVFWGGGFASVAWSEEAKSLLEEHPGVWHPAVGLALQAMGLATVQCNLLPEKSGLLTGILKRKKGAHSAWGVDFGSYAIKAVRMTREGDRVRVDKAVHIPHEEVLGRTASDAYARKLITDSVKKLGEAIDTKEPIFVGISPIHMLARFIDLPNAGRKGFQEVLAYEAKHQFPIDLDQLYWAHHVFDPGSDSGTSSRNAVLIASRKAGAEQILNPVLADKWNLVGVQSTSIALHNAMIYDRSGNAAETFATIEVGATMSVLMVSSLKRIWHVGVPIGGTHFTAALTSPFRLTFSQAESLKKKPFAAKLPHQLFDAWSSTYSQFETELQRAFDAWRKQANDPDACISLSGVGGGFNQHRLYRRLRHGD